MISDKDKDIEKIINKSKELTSLIHENCEIKLLKDKYNLNLNKNNIDFFIIEEHYKTIINFQNSLDKLNYTIYITNNLYKRKDLNYILLYNKSNEILDELKITLNSIIIQAKNINLTIK